MSFDPSRRDTPEPLDTPAWQPRRVPSAADRCFADEVVIDFPSVGDVVERMRDAFLGEGSGHDVLSTEVRLSRREARAGLTFPLDVPVRCTCSLCGGRGESWTELCQRCAGTGESLRHHAVRMAVPPGVADGARFSFRITPPDAASVRIEVRVAIRPSAA